jgi:hypothetical protein
LYAISCTPDRVKIGVAGDARKRLRELQVGSPVELKLAHAQRYPDRRDAEAVAEELYRCFASRRVRGSWYRLSAPEVREALARRATVEAPARARAAAEAAARDHPVAPRPGAQAGAARTAKQLAYERRRRQERTRKQKRAAKLLGQGMNQEQTALAVGVSTRTLRNWKTAPAFQRERERQHKRPAGKRRRRTASPSRAATETRSPPAPDGRGQPQGRRPRLTSTRPSATVPPLAQEPANPVDRPRSPSTSHHGGVPIFADTPDGRAARLAYYAARKLNNPPNSLLDYNDAKRGLEPPAERRARERRENHPPL